MEFENDIFASVIEAENNTENKKASASENNILDKTIDKIIEERESKAVRIPQHYQIFSTDNGKADGKKDIVDTYYSDKIKGIIPINKAIAKAKLMKNVFKSKVFFVLEVSHSVIEGDKKHINIHNKIIFTA